jgi:NADPH:quinone reductase-like Zn-dependent oxidoreductase
VAALARGPEKAGRLAELGADLVLDRTDGDVVRRVREWSDGRGADVVLDPVGTATWPVSIGALGRLGRYATCGVLTGAEVALNLAPLYAQEQEIVGSTASNRAELVAVLDALARGRLRAAIWRIYPFEAAREALGALGDPERVGKVLLQVGG